MKRAVVLLAIVFAARPAHAEGPEAIGFAKALQLAKDRSPNLRSARADVTRSLAIARQARSAVFPTLTANGTYTRLDGDRVVAGRIAQGVDSLSANLNLTVPIVVFPRWGALRRADDAADVTRAQESAVARDVLLGTARAYLNVLLQRRAVEIATRSRDVSKTHRDYSAIREQGGLGSKLDVVRAAQEVEGTESQLAQANLSLLRAQEALGIALGLDHAVDARDEPSFELDDKRARARADLEAQKKALWAAERGGTDAYRDYIPTLVGSFQPFYQNPPTLTLPETGWQAQLVLQIPLFDGGLRYGQQREREAVIEQAKARLEDLSRRATTEVRMSRAAVGQAETVLARAREAARLAQEAARLSQIAYEAGAATNLELVDADRRARDADSQAALAEDGLRQARLDWLAASGALE